MLTCPCRRRYELRHEIKFRCSCGRTLEVAWSKPLINGLERPPASEPVVTTALVEAHDAVRIIMEEEKASDSVN
jgi:hypothetical protein